MSRGFYTLTSGMLTQQRKIDVHSNNLANVNTNGYKKEQATSTTFGDLVLHKMKDDKVIEEIGSASLITTMGETNNFHSQGSLLETGRSEDFAILGEGFFRVVEDGTGRELFTRNGSFNIDTEGYLVLEGTGRVQGEFGDIEIVTDKFEVTNDGSIIVDGEVLDRIEVYNFENYGNLVKAGEGLFTGVNGELVEIPEIMQGTLEKSNVDITKEITNMMESQRALQNASQALKMYDSINDKTVNEIGRVQ